MNLRKVKCKYMGMYLTGSFYTLESRFHQFGQTQTDIDSYMAEYTADSGNYGYAYGIRMLKEKDKKDSILTGSIYPTYSFSSFTATDGAGTGFNNSDISVNTNGANPYLLAFVHSEFYSSNGLIDPWTWSATYNGQVGRLLVKTDGYHGGSGNGLFQVWGWNNPPTGTHNLNVRVGDGTPTGTINPGAQELTVAAVLLNNVAQTMVPIRAFSKDISTGNRTAESVTVASTGTDLVLHAIASSFTTAGTLGAGETSLIFAQDGTDDASLLISSKPGSDGTTSVSSTAWPTGFPVQGIALSIKTAGTAENITGFTDDCNRVNETTLSRSGTWATPVGASTVTKMSLIGNTISGSTAAENMARISSPLFPADQRIRFKYVAGTTFAGGCVRMQSTGNATCYAASTNGASAIELHKITDNGSSLNYSLLSGKTPSRNLINGDYIELEVSGSGPAVLNVYWNQVLFFTYSDASPLTTGQPGMRVFGAQSATTEVEATSFGVRF